MWRHEAFSPSVSVEVPFKPQPIMNVNIKIISIFNGFSVLPISILSTRDSQRTAKLVPATQPLTTNQDKIHLKKQHLALKNQV